jgi:4-amino-4-deoxy-L-arabinose transferase-like glycosyltransferase
LILAVALAARVTAGFWWQARLPEGTQFFFGDSDSYWRLGQALARGEPYEYLSPDAKVLRTPGYPLLLAAMFRILGNDAPVMAARVLSAIGGTAAVGLVGWWTAQLFDARAARIAGWITALYPGAVSMGAFVLSEAPFCPFMILHLALWGRAWQANTTKTVLAIALAAGLSAGAATLIRPSWLLFIPFAVALALVFDRQRGRQLLIAAGMTAGLVACLAPWWIRNAQVTGHFVATTLQVGASLYDGLSPIADGGSNMSFVGHFADEQRAAGVAAGENFEYELDQRMLRASLDWAAANPSRVAELAWIKFTRIWNVWPNEPSLRSAAVRAMIVATYGPLLALGLVGVWRYSRWGWPYVLAWLPAVYFTLLHVVFVSSIRYREPAMLALAVLAAAVLAGATRNSTPAGAAA